jgi:coenzyme F420 hydrogenase subunit beta
VDCTNVLADITVGCMGGAGEQWLIVRNRRGRELLDLLGDEVRVSAPGRGCSRAGAVKGFAANVARAAGGLPLRAMPDRLRPAMGWLMPRIGPKGLEFARARVEMKAVETVLHPRRAMPRHAAADEDHDPGPCPGAGRPYELTPEADEIAAPAQASAQAPAQAPASEAAALAVRRA